MRGGGLEQPTLTSLPESAMRLHCMLVIFSQLAGSLFLYLSPMYFLMAARLEPVRCVGCVGRWVWDGSGTAGPRSEGAVSQKGC
jgi:hypothetical protein